MVRLRSWRCCFCSCTLRSGLTATLSVVLWILLVTLLVGFRIAVWQLKEVALPRVKTVASGVSVTGSARFATSGASKETATSAHSLEEDHNDLSDVKPGKKGAPVSPTLSPPPPAVVIDVSDLPTLDL